MRSIYEYTVGLTLRHAKYDRTLISKMHAFILDGTKENYDYPGMPKKHQ